MGGEAQMSTAHGRRDVPKVDGAWAYGDAGDRWPVADRDIWQVGPHVVACGDIERGDLGRFLSVTGLPDMVYCDPPWNQGNATTFRTKAGQKRQVDYPSFFVTLMSALASCPGDVYIEHGVHEIAMVRACFEALGLRELNYWEIRYYRTRPCALYRLRTNGDGTPLSGDLFTGVDDEHTPLLAIQRSSAPGQVVLDGCTGRGTTAVAAAEHGCKFIGLELNHRRLAVTIDRLASATGQTPQLVGHLPGG